MDAIDVYAKSYIFLNDIPDCKVYAASMGPIRGPQDTGGPHVGPTNFAIWGNSKWTGQELVVLQLLGYGCEFNLSFWSRLTTSHDSQICRRKCNKDCSFCWIVMFPDNDFIVW